MTTKTPRSGQLGQVMAALGTTLFYLVITAMVFTPAGYTAYMLA
ncbi:hypothetical protein [Hyphomonas sp. BRH_c22]|nr:hypothetical protein [Hyphomonas sp. BRH_c22]